MSLWEYIVVMKIYSRYENHEYNVKIIQIKVNLYKKFEKKVFFKITG